MKTTSFFFCIITIAACIISCSDKTVFEKLSSSHTGIHFNNEIKETDSVNVIDLANVYNGGGVGIGDFNNDGLQDIYFTGNLVSNKLYMNKGDMQFEDVTDKAGVAGDKRWSRGIAVVDINNDGWMDMYVCVSMSKESQQRQNLLYINEGAGKDGAPHFKEMAAAYGLNDTSYTTMAAFFDYDNDGDLDVFLAVNDVLPNEYPNKFRKLITDGSFPSTCRLYQNEGGDSLKHPYYTNVSKQAGITIEGYSHGAVVTDINRDGWKDIYVTNDYLSPNVLYINNHDGTFTDKSSYYFKHTSANAMGQDIADINNDGLQDVFELDMNPEDNFRKKMMMNVANYQTYQNSDYFSYQYQYVRNTLQLNQGPRMLENDTVGPPIFSEIAFMSGVAETDWSWTPMVTDFDNDGYRDIIVTNGFPKDITDHDFAAFRDKAFYVASKQQLLSQIPEVKLKNYAFKNNGDLSFTDVSTAWGIEEPSFSNGAAYSDLDNDGDLDYVVNNINDEAGVYENHSSNSKEKNNYLKINFVSEAPNVNGLGAYAELHYNKGQQQVYENTPYRGYLSTVQASAHFGLGNAVVIDSVIIKWQDGKMQLLKNVFANKVITVQHKDAVMFDTNSTAEKLTPLFTDISSSVAAGIANKDDDFIDFNIQKLLPHKLSDYSPALAAGDINGDGLDDIIMGGSYGFSTQLLLQQNDGKFAVQNLTPAATRDTKPSEDMGLLLFDADGDGDNDLYIAAGGYESEANTSHYRDKLYVNDGRGNFFYDSLAVPQNFTSKSCVRAADIDNDGDLDLFVAGRCLPSKYPSPVSCFIYRNDSKNGAIKFTDATDAVCSGLKNIGMTCDAVFTDFDNDGWADLVMAGEFMPLKFFKNNRGKFQLLPTNIENETGWWNSIVPGDFDNDGDIDFIAGNAGANSFYRPTIEHPIKVYAKDFDNNGSFDAFISMYLPASQKDKTIKEFPAELRDEAIKQMIEMRNKFKTYNEYANATIDKLFSPEQLTGAITLTANNFKSCFIKNDGNGKFTITPLPIQAQLSSIFGMLAEDINGDGNLDVIINGNDFGTEVSIGRYDAMNGLVLPGDGKGNFSALSILQSGIFIPGNGRALVKFANAKGQCLLAASQNNGALKIFRMNKSDSLLKLNNDDVAALLHLQNGTVRRTDFNYGAGFLSQSSRFINKNATIKLVEVIDSKGKKRVIE